MNRQLKFKIYDKNDTNCIIGPFNWNKLPQFLFPENFTLLQYTGLKDKNGKEIYEGDVIKYHRVFEKKREVIELTSCIKFQDGAFGFDMKGFNDMFMSLGDDSDIEVIGNIFENSELLKQ